MFRFPLATFADPLEIKVNNAESVSVSKRHQGQLHVVSQVFSVVATYRVIVQLCSDQFMYITL